MNVIYTMLISSNTLFLLQAAVEYFKGNMFSQRNRYLLLKAALFLSFLPVIFLKPVFQGILYHIMPGYKKVDMTLSGKMPAIMVTTHGYHFNYAFKNNLYVIFIWLGVAFVVFTWHLRKHIRFRNYIQYSLRETFSPELSALIEKYRNQFHIKRNIRIYISSIPVSPFTLGGWKPIIVIPELLDAEKRELVICHEICHIKRHDGAIRFLQTLLVGIYWFNPIVYLLDSYLENYREFTCDEMVIKNLSKASRKTYAHLIIDMAALNASGSAAYITPFSDNSKSTKERINLIMNGKKNTNKFGVLLSVIMVMFSGFTSFAFDAPQTLSLIEQSQETDILPVSVGEMVAFHQNGVIQDTHSHRIGYDSQFVDEQGNAFFVDDNQPLPRKACQHNLVSGSYEKHTKNKNGSCIFKVYAAQRCSKCGSFKIGDFQSESKYAKCPH